MNILYVIHKPDAAAGSAKSFLHMLRGMTEKGVQAIVLLPQRCGLYDELVALGIPVLVVPYYDNVYPFPLNLTNILLFVPKLLWYRMTNRRAVHKVVSLLDGRHVDLVHTNVSICDIGFRVAKQLKVPHVYHIREYIDKIPHLHYYPSMRSFVQMLNRPDSYNVCITKDIQRHYHQQGKDTSVVIYNGIAQMRVQMPARSEGGYFLCAGRVELSKGIDELVKAYCEYACSVPSPIPLYIAGKVFEKDKRFVGVQKKYIEKRGLSSQVHFLGNRTDIEALMLGAKAVVVPSRHEGFGRCMPEAMFCGCLAIACDSGGTHEQLENGRELMKSEIAFHYQTIEQLVELLRYVSARPDAEFDQYRQRAFKVVNSLYTTEGNVQKVFDFYQHILSRRS